MCEWGTALSDLTKNLLFVQLLGTNSSLETRCTLESTTYDDFSNSVSQQFKRSVNAASAIWNLRQQTQGATGQPVTIIPDCGCGYDAARS